MEAVRLQHDLGYISEGDLERFIRGTFGRLSQIGSEMLNIPQEDIKCMDFLLPWAQNFKTSPGVPQLDLDNKIQVVALGKQVWTFPESQSLYGFQGFIVKYVDGVKTMSQLVPDAEAESEINQRVGQYAVADPFKWKLLAKQGPGRLRRLKILVRRS